MGAKSNSTSTPLSAHRQRTENTLRRNQPAKPSQDRGDGGGRVEGATTPVSLKWEAARLPAAGSPSSEARLGLSVEPGMCFSAWEWCYLPCLVSWLDNAALCGGWVSCPLQISVARQQVPCCYLQTTLCIHDDVVPRAGYSKNWPHSPTWCIFDLAFSNATAVLW